MRYSFPDTNKNGRSKALIEPKVAHNYDGEKKTASICKQGAFLQNAAPSFAELNTGSERGRNTNVAKTILSLSG